MTNQQPTAEHLEAVKLKARMRRLAHNLRDTCETDGCELNALTQFNHRRICAVHYRLELFTLSAHTQEAKPVNLTGNQRDTLTSFYVTVAVLLAACVIAYAIAG